MRLFLSMVLIVIHTSAQGGEWTKLASLPDKAGFAGSFAGVSNGVLLVAGGANFPDEKPWEGGKKVWHDTVFVLEKPDGKWKVAGKLPRPLGYGVSVTHGKGIVCVGGSDAKRHYADVFRLVWRDGKLVTTGLPALPKPLANTCGALVGNALYVAGGQEKPKASSTSRAVYRIDLNAPEPKWVEVEAFPGCGRILAAAAAFDGAFWLVGGADLVAGRSDAAERKYLMDAYRYDPGNGWTRIADLPHPVVAAPSPAPTDPSGYYLLGGDDGSQVGADPEKHRGFTRTALRYDGTAEKWVEAGVIVSPRVTVPCVAWEKSWVVPSGEVRPGVRSPDVVCFTPGKKE